MVLANTRVCRATPASRSESHQEPRGSSVSGTSTCTAIDISYTISSDDTSNGGVLGPNSLIYFMPYSANDIGVLNPSSSSFTTIDISNTIAGD